MKTSPFTVFAVAVFLAATPLFASAATIDVAKTVSVSGSQFVADNAYLAGGDVIFSTTAQKDLVAAGGQITVNGPVWGEAILAGGNVQILNEVRGSVRVAGGQVTIGGSVRGDVLAGGGMVTVLPGSVIGGDLIVAGGTVDMEGTVSGQVRAYGGDVTINGTVAGSVTVKAGKSVTFGDKAVVGGAVSYTAPKEASIASGAKVGTPTYVKSEPNMADGNIRDIFLSIIAFLFIAKFIAMLVAALVLVLMFRPFAQTLTTRTVEHFWKKAGIGFAALVVVPAAIVVLAITVIGIYLAIFLGLIYLTALVLAGVYTGILAGGLISKWLKKEAIADWKWSILGTVVVFLLGLVPFVGWIADLILFLAALGAITLSIHRDAKEKM